MPAGVSLGFVGGLALGVALPLPPPDIGFGRCEAGTSTPYADVAVQSRYVSMKDGVRIAIDLALPRDLGAEARLPAMLSPTRYWRAREAQPPTATQTFFVEHGYAVVVMDVRGSGASFGRWLYPWSDDEAKDIAEVVAWITDQPWSNGKVVSVGTSYLGNTAELVARSGDPAVRAVIPRFSDWDTVEDLVYPGGIANLSILGGWGEMVYALDRNVKDGTPPRGVRPVDEDHDGALLAAALRDHERNPRLADATPVDMYRDDRPRAWGVSWDAFATFSHRAELERAQAPLYGWASWLDAGTANGALKRFLTVNIPQRLVIGPWSHGGGHHASPFLPPETPTVPDRSAQLRDEVCFFDQFANGSPNGFGTPEIVYYTLGAEGWSRTPTWPVPTSRQRYYLAPNRTLRTAPPSASSRADRYPVDFEATTGTSNRWFTQLDGRDVVYPNRAGADRRLLAYTSAPLGGDVEITGHPVVTLRVTSTHADGAFFVYLEEVDPEGRVTYVTEGELRAIHRKVSAEPPPYRTLVPFHSLRRADAAPLVPGEVAELTFGLLPTSVMIRRGHRLRLAIAGADKDTFARIPAQGTPVIEVQRSREHPSFVDLPVVDHR